MPDAANPIVRLAADPDDRAAWQDAVAAYGRLCWRIALRMLGDEHEAADAVQESLLAVRAAARRFRSGGDPDAVVVAWVARIAVNICHGHRRRLARIASLPADLAAPVPPAEDLAEHLPPLRAAIAELPRAQREAVELRYLAGLDYPQVATALGVAEGAARVRVHRALAGLRAGLARRGTALGAVALAAVLDRVAEAAVPPPPAAAAAAWSAAPPPIVPVITISTGAIIAMPCLAVIGFAVSLAVMAVDQPPPPPTPAPAQPPSNAAPLEWLASRQQADGGWQADGGETRIAISARAALCFLGMGYDHKTPNVHRETVARALRWLSASGSGPTAESGAWRVMALAEAYAMTADKDLRIPAAEAVTDLIGRRSGAGWPGPAAPPSIDARSTVVGIMALKSAHAAGASPAEVGPALQVARAWVTEVAWTRHAKPFPSTWPIDGSRGDAPGADPEFLAMAVFLGLRAGTEVTDELAARVAGAPPPADPFRHYLRCLGLFQVGGAAWKAMADQGSAAGLTAAAASGAVGRMTFAALEHGVYFRYQAVHKAPVVTPVAPPGEVRAPQGF